MASLAGATLVWPISALDRMWALNPRAHHKELAPFGKAIGIPFLLLAVTLAVAGMGWLKRRLWGWRLAVEREGATQQTSFSMLAGKSSYQDRRDGYAARVGEQESENQICDEVVRRMIREEARRLSGDL